MSRYAAVDVGGTFTDLCLQEDGETTSYKAPTTPDDPTDGILDVLEKAADDRGTGVRSLLAGTDRLVHGTTIATNAIIEDEVAETALLCTAGFPDTLLLREGGKDDPYDWSEDYPEAYVPRSLTFEVDERVTAEGDVVTPLDETGVRETIREVEASDAESVAVAFLWSHIDGDHERRVGELIEEEAPGLTYSLSHQVNPITREYRRTIATAIDASISDLMDDYLSRLERELAARGYEGEPLLITANGGVMAMDEVRRRPIWSVDSGPTMLPVAARDVVGTELDTGNVLALDVGGTSLDIGVVRDGRIPRTREAEVGDDIVGIEKVAVRSIGSGGGSVASVDEGGLLHVGPESAGADPGPACYGRGGDRPTVTDAALVLGYLNPSYFLGGEMTLDREAAVEALRRDVGDPLGIDATSAARTVYAAANQNVVNGVQRMTIERGVDLRNYVLSGGGGALGMHVVPIARELNVGRVLLPGEAGVVSALGGTVSDVRRDFSASHYTTQSDFDADGVNKTLRELAAEADSFFDRAAVPEAARNRTFYTEAQYDEQVWQLRVELPGATVRPADVDAVADAFHDVHRRTYGFRAPDQDIEFLHWRVEAAGATDTTTGQAAPADGPLEDVARDYREAYFDGEPVTAPAYRGDELGPGQAFEGPAFVDARNTTVVVPPGTGLTVTEYGNYLLAL